MSLFDLYREAFESPAHQQAVVENNRILAGQNAHRGEDRAYAILSRHSSGAKLEIGFGGRANYFGAKAIRRFDGIFGSQTFTKRIDEL